MNVHIFGVVDFVQCFQRQNIILQFIFGVNYFYEQLFRFHRMRPREFTHTLRLQNIFHEATSSLLRKNQSEPIQTISYYVALAALAALWNLNVLCFVLNCDVHFQKYRIEILLYRAETHCKAAHCVNRDLTWSIISPIEALNLDGIFWFLNLLLIVFCLLFF